MPRPISDNLFLHDSGQWAKKCRGKLLYFGTDESKAYARWIEEKPYRIAGKQPPRRDGESPARSG